MDGYWLAPALAGAEATVDGRPAAEHLELARSRDDRRATVFHVLATALLGRPDETALGAALPELEVNVPRYQRALWTLAADGHLGADGRALLLRRAGDTLATLSDSDTEEAVAAWRRAVRPERDVVATLPRELGRAEDLIGALDACERLAVLRHWVAGALAKADDVADEVDPVVRRTLELLVDEGSPVELPLLVRERRLRQVIEGSGDGEPESWDTPVGALVELLRADAVDEDRPGRRALAVRICAPHILTAADRFAERARTPLGEQTRARTSLGELMITPAGPVPTSLDTAIRRATAALVVDGRRRRVGYTAAAIGLLLALLSLVAGWGWLVPALAAGALAGAQLWRDRTERAAAAEHRASTEATLRADANRSVEALTRARAELTRRRSRIDEDLAALRASLS
ncbi:MAG TPA: hypothetical protein VGX25_01670 [Actinophytocola sp.]|uniref:hypothetical protein n=1 Tax=Actinophytocola sp. TaxID=1872138 RepID=UPI002DDC9627|nr:hypothetical protein [Actinophytocola sp.]HEV2778086.1 hypothetical protein [Actinophytocola sp.]